MSNQETRKFELQGRTLIVAVTNIDGEWHSRFDLLIECPPDAKQYMLAGREGPYPSAEEAFEKAKQWAFREIEQRTAES